MDNYTYFIMDDSYKVKIPENDLGVWRGQECYVLGKQGVKKLLEKSQDEVERFYIEKHKDKLESIQWAFNMVYVMKQACGHHEVFQTHVDNYDNAMDWLRLMKEESKQRNCTHCVLHS